MNNHVGNLSLSITVVTRFLLLCALTPSAALAQPTLYFPWDADENPWTLTQGPHALNPMDPTSPQSGLDFDKDDTDRRVLSMFDGVVTFVGLSEEFDCGATGQRTRNSIVTVRATDGSGWELSYFHLSSFSVSMETPVSTGDLLGYSGNVGCSISLTGGRGIHLHVDLAINGRPESWLGKSIIGRESPSGPLFRWQVSSEVKNLNSAIDTRPPISPLQNWTMDGSGNTKTSFVRGEAIQYGY
jgi:murein DD-endopeptidase MepM/ murein hydrolase activator NlpD